jgi:signal transduction histidine kinase
MSTTPSALVSDAEEVAVPTCAEELAHINSSLRHRESLLAATAKASRLLLEKPDVMAAVPGVLRLLGEAAAADRVSFMLTQPGPSGERLLRVASEWVAEGVVPYLGHPAKGLVDERCFQPIASELRAGRSVCINVCALIEGRADFEGPGTKTKAIVPIFVESEYVGVVGFDNTRQQRAIDSAELSALETAAGVIGAALHRERLIDAVRRERERAAEERAQELARANAAIRGSLERLASEPDMRGFLGHVVLEAARQLDAVSGFVMVLDDAPEDWRIVAYVDRGEVSVPREPVPAPFTPEALRELLRREGSLLQLDVERDAAYFLPESLGYLREHHLVSACLVPLVFGGRTVGFFGLAFARVHPVDLEHSGMLVALAQQATLAIELTRLGRSAQEAAVLVERNRIGQEIHDGLAQAFTGILMQLGAAEELEAVAQGSPLAQIAARIRDLAREGLAEARRSVMALRPDQTRRGGLETALRQLAERSTVPGRVEASFEGADAATGLAPEIKHELLRIAQEAVSNAVRHAEPHHVKISLTSETAHWVLAIADDGRGMPSEPERCAQQGFGLNSMRERANAIGGVWHIDSAPGTGTRVSVRVPRGSAA